MIYNLLLNEKEKEREREKNRKCHLSREPMYLSLGIHFSRFSHSTKFRHSSSVCVKDPPPSPLKFQPSLASGLKSLAYKFRINETPGGLSPFDIFIYIYTLSLHIVKKFPSKSLLDGTSLLSERIFLIPFDTFILPLSYPFYPFSPSLVNYQISFSLPLYKFLISNVYRRSR